MTPFSGFAPNPVIHLVLGYIQHIPNVPLGLPFCPHFGAIIFDNTSQTIAERGFEACLEIAKNLDESVDNFDSALVRGIFAALPHHVMAGWNTHTRPYCVLFYLFNLVVRLSQGKI
jgi:hypothetical protein